MYSIIWADCDDVFQNAIIPHLLGNLSDKVKEVESYCNTLGSSDEIQLDFDVEGIERTFSFVLEAMNVTEVCRIVNSSLEITKSDLLWSGPNKLS